MPRNSASSVSSMGLLLITSVVKQNVLSVEDPWTSCSVDKNPEHTRMGERATVIKRKTQPLLEAKPRGLGIHAFSEAGNENRASYGSERRNLEGTGNKPKHQGKLSSRQRLSLFTEIPSLCQISHPSHQHDSKSCPSITYTLFLLFLPSSNLAFTYFYHI